MSLLHAEGESPRLMKDGDLVIIYERFDSMRAVTVTARGTFNNKFGNFAMKDWIGKPFGSKLRAKPPSTGWVYVLAPTSELWTQVLRHRTQILYVADISMVCTMMELRPGCTVLESGTGSGSLTTSLARAVAPTGHVHTFEFHPQRATAAADEFQQNGLGDLVTVTQRDIEAQGFPETLHGKADALFLDLPGPWKVVPSASQCLRPDGVFCSFSPCIEQVQRTCEALNANGFREMRTMEVLLRQYDVTHETLIVDLEAAGGPPPKRQQRQQRQQQQQQQLKGRAEGQPSKRQKTEGAEAASQQAKGSPEQKQEQKQEQEEEGPSGGSTDSADAAAAVAANGTVSAGAAAGAAGAAGDLVMKEAEGAGEGPGAGAGVDKSAAAAAAGTVPVVAQAPAQAAAKPFKERRVLARPVPQGRGHTGYLTFARRAVME